MQLIPLSVKYVLHIRNTLDTSTSNLKEYSECVKRAAGVQVSVCCHTLCFQSLSHLWRFYSDIDKKFNPRAAKTLKPLNQPKCHQFWLVVVCSCRCCAVFTPPCMAGGGAAWGWWCPPTPTSAAPCATGRAPPTSWPAPTRWGVMSPDTWPTVYITGNSDQNMGLLRTTYLYV